MTMLVALASRAAPRRCSSLLSSLAAPLVGTSSFSSAPHASEAADGFQEGLRHRPHPQSFVREDIILESGEHIPNSRPGGGRPKATGGPYWRPPWNNRAEILSAEDFANRPRVGFSEEFATMRDAMVVLSWMTQEDREGMYILYCDMMTAMHGSDAGKGGKTSHEYVVRVVAQKYNVTTSRAAGVIQLQHNEEQLKKDPTFVVRHDVQEIVDEKCREHIRASYQFYGEKDPLQFVEDPLAGAGVNPRGEDTSSQRIVRTSDLHDVDALLAQAKIREASEERLAIQRHIYVEDVDDNQRSVKCNKETNQLLKVGQKMLKENRIDSADDSDEGTDDNGDAVKTKIPSAASCSPYPENNRGYKDTPGTRRPRWKYVAQIIDTDVIERKAGGSKRRAAKAKAKLSGRVVEGNTLVECDGELRRATRKELEETSWKHRRDESEFMFKGVKDAWLKRVVHGEVGGWGQQEEVNPEVEVVVEEGSTEEDGEESAEEDDSKEKSDDGDDSSK